MRYVCIDLGDKRTGLALGDDETGIVTPLRVIECPRLQHDRLVQVLASVIHAQRPDALVLGLPLNMDGSEGPAAKAARAFGLQLAGSAGLPVHFQDERLTSYAADQRMAQTGRTHKQKKQVRDALAAVEVLNDFLASRTLPPPGHASRD